MRPGTLIPVLVLAALVAPPLADADSHRSGDRGRRTRYERSGRGDDRGNSYRRGDHPGRRGHYRPAYRHHRPVQPRYRGRYRSYYRPYYPAPRYYYGYRPHPGLYYPPWPGPYVYPGPAYGPGPWHRGGVHGHVSIGLPFVGFSLHF
jgi:hypothetical protein